MLGFAGLLLLPVIGTHASADEHELRPSITGDPISGSTLVASVSGSDSPHHYRWQRCDGLPADCDVTAEWVKVGDSGSSYILDDADVGSFVRVQAKYTKLGRKTYYSSDPVGPVTAPDEPEPEPVPAPPGGSTNPSPPPSQPLPTSDPPSEPQPRSSDPLPPPTAYQTANVTPKGTVMIKEPGGQFRELTDPEQVPLGTIFDTTAGRVGIVTARNERGKLQEVEFWAGRFILDQIGAKAPITVAEPTGRGGRASSGLERRAARRKRGRRLWGRGKCRCRTRGRRGSGTVRGTQWLTVERRRGTRFKVDEGQVKVRDFARNRSVMLGAGESYVAKKKKKRR